MKPNDHVRTPVRLSPMFAGFHDPCPLGATEVVEPREGVDIYINPPYSDQEPWVERAIEWHREGHYVVLLIPMETSTLKAKRLIEYGCRRIYFEHRVWDNVRGVELVILTGGGQPKRSEARPAATPTEAGGEKA